MNRQYMNDKKTVKLGKRFIGCHQPTFIIAEIGINHNGDLEIAKDLIDAAVEAGCDAVKFQKRSPELCVPPDQQKIMRETPWGEMTYLAYRYRVEFKMDQYQEINQYCHKRNIDWFASCWDIPSVDFMAQFDPPCFKVASASLTNIALLQHMKRFDQPVILSTGMSTMKEIKAAVAVLSQEKLLIAHSTSSYVCPPEELNLRVIQVLQEEFECPIGYSGHEAGLLPSLVAVAMGACFVERHITLDRNMWGSDQAASLEPKEFNRLVKNIREIEIALGDGVKRIYDTERSVMAKLRDCR